MTAYNEGQEGPVTDQLEFIVNSPPLGGNCSVNPLSGIAMETKFQINCSGWREFYTSTGHLTYEYRIQQKGSRRANLLFYGDLTTPPEIFFPVGSPTDNFAADLIAYIYDPLGDRKDYIFNVYVSDSQTNVIINHMLYYFLCNKLVAG